MKEITPILNRIKQVLNAKTDKEMTEKWGISYSTLDTWKNRDTIPQKRLLDFSLKYGVSLDWLITGNGDIYSHPPTSPQPLPQTQISKLSPKMDELVYLFSILDKKDQKRIYKEIKTLADEKMDLSFLDEE